MCFTIIFYQNISNCTFNQTDWQAIQVTHLVRRTMGHGEGCDKVPTRCPRHREMRDFFPAWPGKQSWVISKLHRRLHSLSATQWSPRDTRRESTGERSPFFPLKTRPDSPGESRMQPWDPCRPSSGTLGRTLVVGNSDMPTGLEGSAWPAKLCLARVKAVLM